MVVNDRRFFACPAVIPREVEMACLQALSCIDPAVSRFDPARELASVGIIAAFGHGSSRGRARLNRRCRELPRVGRSRQSAEASKGPRGQPLRFRELSWSGSPRQGNGRDGPCCPGFARRSCRRPAPSRSRAPRRMDRCRSSCGSRPRLPWRCPCRLAATPRGTRPRRFDRHGRCRRSKIMPQPRRSGGREWRAIRSCPAPRSAHR
jgi:hypothetical protein